MNSNKLAITLSSAIAFTVGASTVSAAENPFQLNTLDQGYQVADASTKSKEGKCAAGKCGAHKKTKAGAASTEKAKEGTCSADKMKEGTCSAEKMKEGACSAEKMKEGSCHADKK